MGEKYASFNHVFQRQCSWYCLGDKTDYIIGLSGP